MTRFWLSILLLTVVFISPVLSQRNRISDDLQRSFRSFSLTRLDANRLSTGSGSRTASIVADFGNFDLKLVPHDLRSPNYRAEETTTAGVRFVERGPVTTYKGTVDGDPSSRVRVSIEGDMIEGFFIAAGETFFVEPATRYSKSAAPGDHIVYRQSDVLLDTSFVCETELMKDIQDGKRMISSGSGAELLASSLDIATEADFDFYQTNSSNSVATNNKILSILNMTEGLYESEVNLTIRVTFQHTYAAPDGYDGSGAAALLESFRVRWNTMYPTDQYPRDTAHLFTYKPNVRAQGYAFLSVICNNPNYAYGLSGRVDPSWGWEEANFLVTSHEIAHNLGASHSDTLPSCTNSLMQSQLNGSTLLTFCSYSRGEITTFVGNGGTCMTPANTAATPFDFDGDGKSDMTIFRPSNGTWFIANSGSPTFNIFQFGMLRDIPVAADYDGDGRFDPAIFRAGVWWRLKSSNNTFDAVNFGVASDLPAPADFDGDGSDDVVVFRAVTGTWHRLLSANGAYSPVQFGLAGDVPVPADYDGDGKADLNVFRPSNGVWYRTNSGNNSFFSMQFGMNGDRPLPGDFDGDGKNDPAIFRPSTGTWFVNRSSDNGYQVVGFGIASDVPVAGDFDGDGKSDIAVWRPESGVWHKLNSSNGGYSASQFGISSDVPVAGK